MSDPSTPKPKKLLDQVRDAIRLKHYSYSTEKTYVHWARRYILFHNKRHPAEMGAAEIEAFLSHLAKNDNVSSSTQNQALNALLFLYRNVLQIDLAIPIHALRAKPSEYLPTVLSKDETARVLSGMQGLHQLMAKLLYGCGLRLMECMRLRVKDIDFEQSQIIIREGKGEKDRATILPASMVQPLKNQIDFVRKLHERDIAQGYGSVELPYCPGSKISQCGQRICLAVYLPVRSPFNRSAQRDRPPPSFGSQRASTSGQSSRKTGENR
jgi:integron integrase